MRINIQGAENLKSSLNDYVGKRTRALVDEINKTVLNVESGAKRLVPVDTGRLRSSIHAVSAGSVDSETGVTTGKEEGAVVTNVEYAPDVERNSPYLFPAWEAERPNHIRRVKEVFKL